MTWEELVAKMEEIEDAYPTVAYKRVQITFAAAYAGARGMEYVDHTLILRDRNEELR